MTPYTTTSPPIVAAFAAIAMFIGVLSPLKKLPRAASLATIMLFLMAIIVFVAPEINAVLGVGFIIPGIMGVLVGYYIRPCPMCSGHLHARHLALELSTMSLLAIHSLFDGHLLREFGWGFVGAALLMHKMLDGVAIQHWLRDAPRSLLWAVFGVSLTATIAGTLMPFDQVLINWMSAPTLQLTDALLQSFIIGLYVAIPFQVGWAYMKQRVSTG